MKKLFRNANPTRYEMTRRTSEPLFASWYVSDPESPHSLHAFGRFEDALAYFLA